MIVIINETYSLVTAIKQEQHWSQGAWFVNDFFPSQVFVTSLDSNPNVNDYETTTTTSMNKSTIKLMMMMMMKPSTFLIKDSRQYRTVHWLQLLCLQLLRNSFLTFRFLIMATLLQPMFNGNAKNETKQNDALSSVFFFALCWQKINTYTHITT